MKVTLSAYIYPLAEHVEVSWFTVTHRGSLKVAASIPAALLG